MHLPSITRLVPLLLLLGCGSGTAPTPSGSETAAQPPDGAKLFQRRCAVCHGAAGEGMEMAMGGHSANLTDSALQLRLTDAALVGLMMNGVGKMPAVSGLRQAEATAIAAHVRSLRKP